MEAFRVCVVVPHGYVHAACFAELALLLRYSLTSMGYDCDIALNELSLERVNIILGGHLLGPETRFDGHRVILYQLEQLSEFEGWFSPERSELLSRADAVWDYSPENIAFLQKKGIPATYVPLGFHEALKAIPEHIQKDIDVLFVGSLNERRKRILTTLRERGYTVKEIFGVYGKIRDQFIARSRLIINIHFYETSIFEAVRISYLLNNRAFVITEQSSSYPWAGVPLPCVTYDELVDACSAWLSNEDRREKVRIEMARAFERLYPMTNILAKAIEQTEACRDARRAKLEGSGPPQMSCVPKILNIGSGKDFRENCLNIDFNEYWNPDIVLDLCEPVDHQAVYQTRRFGPVRLDAGYFNEILANDVLEHLPDLATAMSSCLALLCEGGRMRIRVPYDLSHGAWQDPTHVRAFNERSWLYYTDWYWYLGWRKARFDLEELVFTPSSLGTELIAKGTAEADLLRVPRAIDEMQVVLRKRRLNLEEEAVVERFPSGSGGREYCVKSGCARGGQEGRPPRSASPLPRLGPASPDTANRESFFMSARGKR